MEKVIANQYGFRKSSAKASTATKELVYNEKFVQTDVVLSLKAKMLAIALFLYFFIERGTLGLLPPSSYFIYRSIRISDFIQYALIIYSFFCIKEYITLFRSKSFLIVKLILLYIVLEFIISAISYQFNVIEYFFRLKGVWSSFLVFPYILLYKRNGFGFLFKLIFPAAVISSILYIMTALTGTAFLPDVEIITQKLPGDLEVYRVYGGTFFGEFFLFGFIYLWITKRFKLYQLFFVVLFMMPHILAFGRGAWLRLAFTIFLFVLLNSIKKKNFKTLFRQALILSLLCGAIIFSFIKFIPDSDYYIEALSARIFQGEEDIKYNEGTYAERGIQNNALVKLWLNSNPFIGIGMHPMWVYRPETQEERLLYGAFSDVAWASVLAAYGIIGFILAISFQIYYLIKGFKILRKSTTINIYTFLLTTFLAQLIFDVFLGYSHTLVSVGLWGLGSTLSFGVANFVFLYESTKSDSVTENLHREPVKTHRLYGRYYNSSYRVYKLKD
jgi:hypothetical protein